MIEFKKPTYMRENKKEYWANPATLQLNRHKSLLSLLILFVGIRKKQANFIKELGMPGFVSYAEEVLLLT